MKKGGSLTKTITIRKLINEKKKSSLSSYQISEILKRVVLYSFFLQEINKIKNPYVRLVEKKKRTYRKRNSELRTLRSEYYKKKGYGKKKSRFMKKKKSRFMKKKKSRFMNKNKSRFMKKNKSIFMNKKKKSRKLKGGARAAASWITGQIRNRIWGQDPEKEVTDRLIASLRSGEKEQIEIDSRCNFRDINKLNALRHTDFNFIEKEKIIEYAFSNCVLYSDYCKSKDIISVNQGIREDSLDNKLIIEYLRSIQPRDEKTKRAYSSRKILEFLEEINFLGREEYFDYPYNFMFLNGYYYGEMVCEIIQIKSEIEILEYIQSGGDMTPNFKYILDINDNKLELMKKKITEYLGVPLDKIDDSYMKNLFKMYQLFIEHYYYPQHYNYINNILLEELEDNKIFNYITVGNNLFYINIKKRIQHFYKYTIQINYIQIVGNIGINSGNLKLPKEFDLDFSDLQSVIGTLKSKINELRRLNTRGGAAAPGSDATSNQDKLKLMCQSKSLQELIKDNNDKVLNTQIVFDGAHDFSHNLSRFNLSNNYLPGSLLEAKNIFNQNIAHEHLYLFNTINGKDGFILDENRMIPPMDKIKILVGKRVDYRLLFNNLFGCYDQGKFHTTESFEFAYNNDKKLDCQKNIFNSIAKVWDASSGNILTNIYFAGNQIADEENSNIHNFIGLYIFWRYWIEQYYIKKYISNDTTRFPIIIYDIVEKNFKLAYIDINNTEAKNPILVNILNTRSLITSKKYEIQKDVGEFIPLFNEKTFVNIENMMSFYSAGNINLVITGLLYDNNSSVNIVYETVKQILNNYGSCNTEGTGRGSLKDKNNFEITKNINLEFLNTIYGDATYTDISVSFKKIKTCYMFKHSGDTCQAYLSEICNTFCYTEDNMLICTNIINNNKVVSCNEITALGDDENAEWPFKKNNNTLYKSIFKDLLKETGKFTICYNLKNENIEEIVEKIEKTTESTDKRFINIKINNKGRFSYIYLIKELLDIVTHLIPSRLINLQTKKEENILRYLIKYKNDYEVKNNIELPFNVFNNFSNINNIKKSRQSISLRTQKKILTILPYFKGLPTNINDMSLNQYFIYCFYRIENSCTNIDVNLNLLLDITRFNQINKKINKIYESFIVIHQKLKVTKHLNTRRREDNQYLDGILRFMKVLNTKSLNNNTSIIPVKFLIKKYIAGEQITNPIIDIETMSDERKNIYSTLFNEFKNIENIVKNFNNVLEDILFVNKIPKSADIISSFNF